MTPAAIERQLVDAGAVDDERPFRAEAAGDLGDLAAASGDADAEQLAASCRPGWSAGRAG